MNKKEILESLESLMYKHDFPAQVEIDLYHIYLRVKYEWKDEFAEFDKWMLKLVTKNGTTEL